MLRKETEWVELVENGTCILADADEEKIIEAYATFVASNMADYPPLFGDGKAAEFICGELMEHLN